MTETDGHGDAEVDVVAVVDGLESPVVETVVVTVDDKLAETVVDFETVADAVNDEKTDPVIEPDADEQPECEGDDVPLNDIDADADCVAVMEVDGVCETETLPVDETIAEVVAVIHPVPDGDDDVLGKAVNDGVLLAH